MPKLTEYQIKTLRRIAEGSVWGTKNYETSRPVYSYTENGQFANGAWRGMINWKTIQALERLGLIYTGWKTNRLDLYVKITDAGKEAIAEASDAQTH